ncbi:MAG: alkaline phosphatase family protein [Acidobacteriota bacterium]
MRSRTSSRAGGPPTRSRPEGRAAPQGGEILRAPRSARPAGRGRRIACLLLAAAALGCGPAERRGEGDASPGGRAAPRGRVSGRVVVIGIDGADWRVIDPLIGRGLAPAFARLRREGATGILGSMEPSASPSLWTTVATGVGPERHGIRGFVVPAAGRAGPRVRPVTSAMRRAPPFWKILSHYGRSVGVVGWLVSWPAEPVNGYVVSSYLPYIYNWSTGRPLKGTIVEGIPRQTFPEELIGELEPLKIRPTDLDEATLRRFYDPARLARLPAGDRACVEGFRWSLASDETYRRIALKLFEERPVDLLAVYFGGVDVASHRFWKFAYPEDLDYDVTAEEQAVLGRVIDEYYIHVDRLVGEYLDRLRPQDTLVVLSDHGFRPVLTPGRPTISGHHRPEGILALHGGRVYRGNRIRHARLVDVLPTLLVLLEVPIAMELEGHVLGDALDPWFAVDHPPRFVDAYVVEGADGEPEEADVERNVLERLRSLGYIR